MLDTRATGKKNRHDTPIQDELAGNKHRQLDQSAITTTACFTTPMLFAQSMLNGTEAHTSPHVYHIAMHTKSEEAEALSQCYLILCPITRSSSSAAHKSLSIGFRSAVCLGFEHKFNSAAACRPTQACMAFCLQ
jgi:hypothetical protein